MGCGHKAVHMGHSTQLLAMSIQSLVLLARASVIPAYRTHLFRIFFLVRSFFNFLPNSTHSLKKNKVLTDTSAQTGNHTYFGFRLFALCEQPEITGCSSATLSGISAASFGEPEGSMRAPKRMRRVATMCFTLGAIDQELSLVTSAARSRRSAVQVPLGTTQDLHEHVTQPLVRGSPLVPAIVEDLLTKVSLAIARNAASRVAPIEQSGHCPPNRPERVKRGPCSAERALNS